MWPGFFSPSTLSGRVKTRSKAPVFAFAEVAVLGFFVASRLRADRRCEVGLLSNDLQGFSCLMPGESAAENQTRRRVSCIVEAWREKLPSPRAVSSGQSKAFHPQSSRMARA